MPPPPDLAQLSLMASAPAPAPEGWASMPYDDVGRFDANALLAHWSSLHSGTGQAVPSSWALTEGWALYHSGEFARAAAIGLRLGREGQALVNQATAIYATYLEPREGLRQALFREVAERAATQSASDPDDCQALYWQAYALGRYCHTINVMRAFALGLESRVKGALERVLALQPDHAEAHIALASFHADAINKVGTLVAQMTYHVSPDSAMELYERGLRLHPASPFALMEYARGLLMLFGEARLDDAARLYRQAAAIQPVDARERLDVELARAGVHD